MSPLRLLTVCLAVAISWCCIPKESEQVATLFKKTDNDRSVVLDTARSFLVAAKDKDLESMMTLVDVPFLIGEENRPLRCIDRDQLSSSLRKSLSEWGGTSELQTQVLVGTPLRFDDEDPARTTMEQLIEVAGKEGFLVRCGIYRGLSRIKVLVKTTGTPRVVGILY